MGIETNQEADIHFEETRYLIGERVENTVRRHLETEACIDIRGAATLLCISVAEARKHAKHWPLVNLSERVHRYRIKDVLAYRDRLVTSPKR